ncbi:50S ribosomal protein L32 [Natronogracilivirga saccharolytica]|uniref:Large ribosomal subunit protein bL32 n=1 Tax=Natronogracilivirga saccharolytica TaxID=2812953 RepID=A0A8J7RLT9_9BACT|nr:50S ribosomal protein L32 [Natronogracilivirga saccharolytica]MBP3192483.1 50S ribosomal protein L32 [Natronogracilivirga saccharolytica]
MAHPKRKTSKARRDKRRTHKNLGEATLTECPNCGAVHQRHRACAECGYYRGRQVIKAASEV